MVDCFDRIAVQMTELALEPVRMLRQRAMLSSVSLRTPSNGKRFLITISKLFPDGERAAPAFTWSITEITPEGQPQPNGFAASADDHRFADPEAAYWAAVEGLCKR